MIINIIKKKTLKNIFYPHTETNKLPHPNIIPECNPLEPLTDIDVVSKQHVIASSYIILGRADTGLSCRL